MACFLCPANTNRKSYPDSRLKAHLFAMHGCKVTQTAIRCNMCSFAAESVRQLGLHVQITHQKKVTHQGQSQGQGGNPPKKPLNPEFIRRLSDAGIAVSKRGVEVTVVDDDDDKGSAAKYARKSEQSSAVTVDKKGLDLFIVGEVNRNNSSGSINSGGGVRSKEHSPLIPLGSAQRSSSVGQPRTIAQAASMPRSEPTRSSQTAAATSAMSKEQARQRAIQDLRARLTSKLKLNAQLQKMASTPNIENTKAKVLKELQMMKSQLQALVKNVDAPRQDSGRTPPPNGLNSHKQPQTTSLRQPQTTSLKQPQTSVKQQPPAPVRSPAPAKMKCALCPFTTTSKAGLISHAKQHRRAGGIKPTGPKEDEVEVVPQSQGNSLTFQIKEQSQGCGDWTVRYLLLEQPYNGKRNTISYSDHSYMSDLYHH